MAWLDQLENRQTRQLRRDLQHSAYELRDAAQDHVQHFAQEAARVGGRAMRQVADYGQHEGSALAQAAAVRALKAGRAMRADPVPAIVGAVGIALLASLLLGRRR